MDLQAERVERKVWRHSQDPLGVAHVGVAECALQVVETGVTGQQGSCGETGFSKQPARQEKPSVTGLNVLVMSGQLANRDIALRWYLLVEAFCV